MRHFSFHYSLYGLLLAGLAWSIQQVFPGKEVLVPAFWVLFILLFLLTYIAYAVAYSGIKKGTKTSPIAVLGGLFVKLILAMVLALVFSRKHSVNQVVFAINYFSLYLLLTSFEVIYLLRNLRDQINK